MNTHLLLPKKAVGGALGWQQGYTYDRWGNRTINVGATSGVGIPSTRVFGVNAATNRLVVPSGAAETLGYDAAGNLITDTYTGGGTRSYDAEGRISEAQDSGGEWSGYTYDGAGRRVKRSTGGGATEVWQVYGMDGEVVAEYAANAATAAPQKEYGLICSLMSTQPSREPPDVLDRVLITKTPQPALLLLSKSFDGINAGGTHRRV